MKNHLHSFVWEITQRCNLHCRHCGSDCMCTVNEPELSLEDALHVARDLEQFNIERVVFSGGEPLMCTYWRELAQAFGKRADLKMVTNGTLLTKETAYEMKSLDFNSVSVSVDGTEQTHDNRRADGSFAKCMEAIENIREAGLTATVNTTVTKDNIKELSQLQKLLCDAGVASWQLQPAIPSGRMDKCRDSVLSPEDIREMIMFSYSSNIKNKTPVIILAETIGYYSTAETLSRKAALGTDNFPVWRGCQAGIRAMGILASGRLTGCISLRDSSFHEKNVVDIWRSGMTILEYWNSPDSFKWRREFRSEMLGKVCSSCQYAEFCLGGCSNVRYCMNGTIESDNPLCVYAAFN